MSFIRPEIAEGARRFRLALVALGVAALGAWIVAASHAALPLGFGIAVFALGIGFTILGIQRGLITGRQGGPGVVELEERQVTYLTAQGGSAFSLDDVSRITIETRPVTNALSGPGRHAAGHTADQLVEMTWIFEGDALPPQRIPASAAGADVLVDALAMFDGADMGAVVRAAGATRAGTHIIWQKARRRLH